MKKSLVILAACLLCLSLSACGQSDKFVGVWEGKLGSQRLPSSSLTILAQIERSKSENEYYVKTLMKAGGLPTMEGFNNVRVISNMTARLEGKILRFEDNSTAEIDSSGRLHMRGEVYTKTNYKLEIF